MMRRPEPSCRSLHAFGAPIRALDLRAAGVSAVIWATGYAFDYGWIKLPVLDGAGAPVHRAGAAEVPGLYFLGLPWMARMPSAFLVPEGMGRDAASDRGPDREAGGLLKRFRVPRRDYGRRIRRRSCRRG